MAKTKNITKKKQKKKSIGTKINSTRKKSIKLFSQARSKGNKVFDKDNRYLVPMISGWIFLAIMLVSVMILIFTQKWIYTDDINSDHVMMHNYSWKAFIALISWKSLHYEPYQIPHNYDIFKNIIWFNAIFLFIFIYTIFLTYMYATGKNKSFYFNTKFNIHIVTVLIFVAGLVSYIYLSIPYTDYGAQAGGTISYWSLPDNFIVAIGILIIIPMVNWYKNVKWIDPEADPLRYLKVFFGGIWRLLRRLFSFGAKRVRSNLSNWDRLEQRTARGISKGTSKAAQRFRNRRR